MSNAGLTNPRVTQTTSTTSKRNRKEAALSPPENNLQPKRLSVIEKMDLEQISKLLDKKLQPISDKLETLADIVHKNAQLEKRLNEQDKQIASMQKEIEFLRITAANKNLIFKNITWGEENKLDLSVKEFCKDTLKMTETIEIEDARFLDNKKKVICVEFRSKNIVQSVLKNANKLKGTKMRIEKDYPMSVRSKNNKLLAVRKELNKNVNNCNIKVSNASMWLQNKKFTWDHEKGLLVDGTDGVKYLHEKFGVDISNLVEKLKAENREQGSQEAQIHN